MVNQIRLKTKLTGEMVKEAMISLASYKLRSFLTILGIIIGVSAVVIMVSLGTGVQASVNEHFSGLGSNLLLISPGAPGGHRMQSGNVQTLTYEDAADISNFNFVEDITYNNSTSTQVVYDSENINASVYGVVESYFDVINLTVENGRSFSEKEINSGYSYALIGSSIRDDLFGEDSTNVVGKTIRIKNNPFTVIGVLKESGSIAFINPDEQILIPFKAFSRRIKSSTMPKSVNQILLNITEEDYISYAEEKITELLRKNHKLRGSQDDDFRIMNMAELAETVKSTTRMFTILLASIASISLLVGSIGIMNMMLVSVTERTREIGLRKAIGAPEHYIMQQFLFEAVTISFLGSFIGLVLGSSAAIAIGYFTDIDMPISIFSVILSIVVSIIVGVSSGIFPAIQAAKLNPIDALRYE